MFVQKGVIGSVSVSHQYLTWDLLFSFQGLFDVQLASVKSYSPWTVNVSCVFAKSSRALGCLVVLHPLDTSHTEMFAYAARDNSSAPTANISIPGVPKGSHTVLVFDSKTNQGAAAAETTDSLKTTTCELRFTMNLLQGMI